MCRLLPHVRACVRHGGLPLPATDSSATDYGPQAHQVHRTRKQSRVASGVAGADPLEQVGRLNRAWGGCVKPGDDPNQRARHERPGKARDRACAPSLAGNNRPPGNLSSLRGAGPSLPGGCGLRMGDTRAPGCEWVDYELPHDPASALGVRAAHGHSRSCLRRPVLSALPAVARGLRVHRRLAVLHTRELPEPSPSQPCTRPAGCRAVTGSMAAVPWLGRGPPPLTPIAGQDTALPVRRPAALDGVHADAPPTVCVASGAPRKQGSYLPRARRGITSASRISGPVPRS